MLRDDSLHNRWVNSRALAILGVNAASPDPAGGRYVRDVSLTRTSLIPSPREALPAAERALPG
jgi:predicted amidohydrolase YtcJ